MIAFVSARDGNWEIYVMTAQGADVRRLTDGPAQDGYPSWSADGREIVFTSDRDSNMEVYVMAADGSGQRNLTHDDAWDFSPIGCSQRRRPESGRMARRGGSEAKLGSPLSRRCVRPPAALNGASDTSVERHGSALHGSALFLIRTRTEPKKRPRGRDRSSARPVST